MGSLSALEMMSTFRKGLPKRKEKNQNIKRKENLTSRSGKKQKQNQNNARTQLPVRLKTSPEPLWMHSRVRSKNNNFIGKREKSSACFVSAPCGSFEPLRSFIVRVFLSPITSLRFAARRLRSALSCTLQPGESKTANPLLSLACLGHKPRPSTPIG